MDAALTVAIDKLRSLLDAVLKLPGFRGAICVEFHVDSDAKSIKVVHRIQSE